MAPFFSNVLSPLACLLTITHAIVLPLVDGGDALQVATVGVAFEAASTSLEPQAGPKWKPWNRTNQTQFCDETAFNDADKSVGEMIWYSSGAAINLDIWVNGDEKYKDWVQKLDMNHWDTRQSEKWKCGSVTGTCGPPEKCKDMFHGVNPSNYYIFSSVATVHRMFRFFYENLQNNVLLNSLFIDDLVKEFGTEPKNVNPWGVAAGSFGIASGLAAPLSGPISGGLGVISGAFGVTAAHFKPKTSDYGLKTMLGDYFNQSMIALEDTLADIMGEGDPSKIPMAAQTNFQLQTSVGRFFGDGKFLLNSPNAEYRKRQALVIRILSTDGAHIHIDTDLKTEDDCLGNGRKNEHPSRKWKSGMCWTMYHAPFVLNAEPSPREPSNHKWSRATLDKGKVDLLTGKYKVDLDYMYQIAWDCKEARGGGDREVDVDTLPYDGTLPTCFFNIDTLTGQFKRVTGLVE